MSWVHVTVSVIFFALVSWAVLATALRLVVWRQGRARSSPIVTLDHDPRRRHAAGLPKMGGWAIYCALALELGLRSVASAWIERIGIDPIPLEMAAWQMVAYSLVFAVGVLEDRSIGGRRARWAILIAAAVSYVLSKPPGLEHLLELGISNLPMQIAVIIWMIGVSKAMNAIDGLEGLAAGLSAVSAFAICGISMGATGGAMPTLTALVLAAACLGVLKFNHYPASVLLGSGGGRLLGFALAGLAAQVGTSSSYLVSLATPLLLVGVPLIDLGLIVALRRPLRRGDRSHLHHRLQQLGLRPRAAVYTLWIVGAYFSVVAWSLSKITTVDASYVLLSVFPMAAFWVLALRFVERRMALKAAQYGHLFVQRKDSMFVDRSALVSYLRERRGQSFSVVVFDSTEYMRQIAIERPIRVVEFHMNLYAILKARLRRTDYVARMNDHRLVAILANNDGRRERDQPLIDYLNVEIRALQESFGVFQSEQGKAEGLRVLRYPQEDAEIWSVLEISPLVFESPDASGVEHSSRAA